MAHPQLVSGTSLGRGGGVLLQAARVRGSQLQRRLMRLAADASHSLQKAACLRYVCRRDERMRGRREEGSRWFWKPRILLAHPHARHCPGPCSTHHKDHVRVHVPAILGLSQGQVLVDVPRACGRGTGSLAE